MDISSDPIDAPDEHALSVRLTKLSDPSPAVSELGRTIERDRTRKFLISHALIIGITALTMVGNLATGAVEQLATLQFFAMVVIIGGLTAYGTWLYRTGRETTRLVTHLLYIDSAVGLVYFYLAGEFETPAMGLLTLPIIMAPVYTTKHTVWGIAAVQIALYLFLMSARIGGWLEILPYGYMVNPEDLAQPQFVVLSIGAFITVTVSVAMLAGEASIDILTSRQQLRSEVERQTHELAEAKSSVERAYTDLAAINQELRGTNLALAQFNAAISHDLRAPLQSLTLHLEMLAEDSDLPEAGRKRAERGLAATDRMAHMIRDLMDLAQVSDRLNDRQEVDLDVVLEQAMEDLDARIQRSQATVERMGALPVVQGNEGLLRRVVQNLIENGIKYGGGREPKVYLMPVPAPAGRAAFAVEDDGPGIDTGDEQRIFRLFQRLERHVAKEGTGAGLAIVHRIVRAHNGVVRVERGQTLGGARFVIELDAPTLHDEPSDAHLVEAPPDSAAVAS